MTLVKTRGIVFRYIRYKETSIIATIFTDAFGTQSYLINGVRSKKPRIAIALFQPLTLLDMVVYHKENASLHRASEIKCLESYSSIPADIRKSSICLFLSEVLYKCIKHESHPEQLFQFLQNSFLSLEHMHENFQNFHLQFLLKLTSFLGFQPSSGTSLREQLLHGAHELEEVVDHFLKEGYNQYLSIGNSKRSNVLENIIDYYRLHVEGFGTIQSYDILHEVMHS